MAGRMSFDRFIARYDFADNLAAADAISGAAITANAFAAVTTAAAISPTRPGRRLPAVSRI
jgi:hypothetical protein